MTHMLPHTHVPMQLLSVGDLVSVCCCGGGGGGPCFRVPQVRVFSSPVSLEEYPSAAKMPLEDVVAIMLGDLQRIRLYAPPHGDFQIAQHIPDDVWAAFEFLAHDPQVRARHPRFQMNLISKK